MAWWCWCWRRFLAGLVLASLALAASAAQDPLERPVVVGLLSEFPPYQVWPEGGDPSGVDLHVLDHLQSRVGLRYGLRRFVRFADLRAALERGDIDLAMSTARTAERERSLVFSSPYAQVRQALVARADETAATLAPDLSGRRLGVSRGEVSEARARELFPGALVVVSESLPAVLESLVERRVDYVLDALPAVRRVVESRRMPGLRVLETYSRPEGALSLAMRRGDEARLAALQRGLSLLGPQDVLNWQRESLAPSTFLQVAGEFHATESERAALRDGGPWRVGFVAEDRPFSFIDAQGQPAGLNLDMLRALQERLGLVIESLRPMGAAEALRAAEAGEVDLLLGISETAARRRWLAFVGPFRREPLALLSLRQSGVATLAQCAGGRLALPARHWGRVLVEARYPNIEVVDCGDERDCAQKVLAGEAVATLVQLSRRMAAGQGAEPAGLAVTGVAEELRAEEYVALGNARRDLAPLVRRALEDVMFNDLPSIERKWLRAPLAAPEGVDPALVRRWGQAAVLLLAAALGGWLLHSNSLRRVLDQRKAAQAEAEAASTARARYLSFLAHEVRNTLGGITGAVRLMQERRDPDFADRLLPSLHQSAAGTLQLLNDLLDQGRLDAGHLHLLPSPTDFGALAGAVVEEMQPAAAAKGLRLGLRNDAGAGARRHELDPLRVSQVMRNLVANAIKYTPAGEVEVIVDCTPRGEGQDELRLVVRDTGIGIAPEDRESLFRAYSQAGRGHPGGTGLGLALSRQLAELMGGSIGFDSEPGKGSVFRFVVTAPRSATA